MPEDDQECQCCRTTCSNGTQKGGWDEEDTWDVDHTNSVEVVDRCRGRPLDTLDEEDTWDVDNTNSVDVLDRCRGSTLDSLDEEDNTWDVDNENVTELMMESLEEQHHLHV